ncbi:hypothetical protein AYO41_03470 [Verrucomicrobia bacterium SCGC AG-212-E04]|nr:hypothetical protein AYO41_03470 [Verrucomicrobia bacterium SCGC AG-212-E04]
MKHGDETNHSRALRWHGESAGAAAQGSGDRGGRRGKQMQHETDTKLKECLRTENAEITEL